MLDRCSGEIRQDNIRLCTIEAVTRQTAYPRPHCVGQIMAIRPAHSRVKGSTLMPINLPHCPQPIHVAVVQPEDEVVRRGSSAHMPADPIMSAVVKPGVGF